MPASMHGDTFTIIINRVIIFNNTFTIIINRVIIINYFHQYDYQLMVKEYGYSFVYVYSCLPFIRSGQNHLARHSERGKKTRQAEEEV